MGANVILLAVTPAEAGVSSRTITLHYREIPAFAGMTTK